MSLRNYRAYSMTEALAAVREDLGASAVIIHTRSFTQGGFLGIGRRTVVEVTASPPLEDSQKPSKKSTRPRETAATLTGAPVEGMKLDRERTRLLAQAMAVTLDRDRSEAPRVSASSAAAANEMATDRASRREAAPIASSVPVPTARAATLGSTLASTSGSTPDFAVAQRYLLLSPDRVAKPGIGAAVSVRPKAAPDPAPERVAPARHDTAPERSDPPPDVAGRIGKVASDTPRAPVMDLDAIDRLVAEVISRKAVEPPGRLASLYASLIAQDVGKELAAGIVDDLKLTLSAEELASDHAVRSAAIERIARLLPECRTLAPGADGCWRRDGRPLTIAFVGPTGVGKTTTVAKIGATLRLRHGLRIGLITTDTYRIGAVDQLRTYADIIGAPLEVVLTINDMREAIERLSDRDVILVDTAGRSQNDGSRLSELSTMLASAAPHETHLVLSSVASERTLLREAQAFATVGVDRVVLTKLDEAASLGAVLRVLCDVGHSLSYVTTGQEVPQHIEAAHPARIAQLVVASTLATAASSAATGGVLR